MGALKDAPSTSQLTRLHLVRCVTAIAGFLTGGRCMMQEG